MTMRPASFPKLFWFALKRDVSVHLAPFLCIISHLFRHIRHLPALVKPTSGPNPWNKSTRRRKTKIFVPVINQSVDSEQGSPPHKTQDEKGGVMTEGGVSRKGSFSLGESPRPRVSF